MADVIVLPSNLALDGARPFVYFRLGAGGGGLTGDIYLPVPAGITFADGASYSTIDMGAAGSIIDQVKTVKGREGMSAKRSISDIMDLVQSKASGLLPAAGSEVAMAATRKVLNPNTNTTFEGNTVRDFTFSFTLVARSPSDAGLIRRLHNKFRSAVYPYIAPGDSNILLDYPPVWEISFRNKAGASGENEWLPRISECYLTGLTSTFNASAAMFRVDMSPVEINLSVTFSETRSQTRADIEKLNAR